MNKNEPYLFSSKKALNTELNLSEFVATTGKLVPLSPQNRFDENVWRLHYTSRSQNKQKFLYFAKLGHRAKREKKVDGNQVSSDIPVSLALTEPFLSFAKAMIIHLNIHRKSTSTALRLATLRYLDDALLRTNGNNCPTKVTPEVLNLACSLIEGKNPVDSVVINHTAQLGLIYQTMVELGLVSYPSLWTPPLRNGKKRTRIGKEFDEDRAKKLPSPLALEALAEIFNADHEKASTIFTGAICALMLCTPDRAMEVLYAPLNILTPDWTDSISGEVGTGLRWFPAKGGAPVEKVVIPSMRNIAIRAVQKLKDLSEPARVLARWYEINPTKIYLDGNIEHLRLESKLSFSEIYSILYGGTPKELNRKENDKICNWLNLKGIPRHPARNPGSKILFSDLEAAVIAELPENFPIMDDRTGMKYSEALCIVRTSEFRSALTPFACSFTTINYPRLRSSLRSSKTSRSVFEEHGYLDEFGKFLSIQSHMLRHYLNTLAQQSTKLTQAEIARWSGRNNVQQNLVYNHTSDRGLITKLRHAVGDPTQSNGPFANIEDRVFIRREEFASIKIITAHTTDSGYCIHDYSQSPCEVYGDCDNCEEQVCVKGDPKAERNLRNKQTELIRLDALAKNAFDSDTLGAAEWYVHQRASLDKVSNLLAILDDATIPAGTVVQLRGIVSPSRLEMAAINKDLIVKSYGKTILTMEDITKILSITSLEK